MYFLLIALVVMETINVTMATDHEIGMCAGPQAYIPKRRTLIQVLPPLKFFCYLLMHICILPHHGVRTRV